jgi:hypothetical protein
MEQQHLIRSPGVSAPGYQEVRAHYDDSSLIVYQAYPPEIGESAARAGRLPDWYNRDRMTWIKPSFLWMMYRCGWGTKPGQERVLAIRIKRDGFAWALEHSALSHFDPDVHADRQAWKASLRAPVRIQWDPERDIYLRPLPFRAIQMGLSGEAVDRYVDDWIMDITDVTDDSRAIHDLVRSGRIAEAVALLPQEKTL